MIDPAPDNRPARPKNEAISEGQIVTDRAAESHSEFVHQRATQLVDKVASELGRGNFLPNERQAIYIADELGRMMRSVLALRACAHSTVECPKALWSHQVKPAHLQEKCEGPDDLVTSWDWNVNHEKLLVLYVELFRELIDAGVEQLPASLHALKLLTLKIGSDCPEGLVRNEEGDDWITVEQAISSMRAPWDLEKAFKIEIETMREQGLFSPDCPSECNEISHEDLLRVRLTAHTHLLSDVEGSFNLDHAPDLSLYLLKDSKELFDAAREAEKLSDPVTQKNISYVAVAEALHKLNDNDSRNTRPTIDDVISYFGGEKCLKYFEKMAQKHFPAALLKANEARVEFYKYLINAIAANREFLKSVHDC